MKTFLPLLLALSLLLSSCVSSVQLPAQTAIPSITVVPTSTCTPTATALPSITATPTLSADPMIYQFDGDVTPYYQDLIKEAVLMARYYLLNNLGSDLSRGITIIAKTHSQPQEGFVASSPDMAPYLYFNTNDKDWVGCTATELRFRCMANVAGELTLYWLLQHGCFYKIGYHNASEPTSFILSGLERYVSLKSARVADNFGELNDSVAFSYWGVAFPPYTYNPYDQNGWFILGDVSGIAVKHLADEHGTMAFAQFCDAVGHNVKPTDAFQSEFGISVQDFRSRFMDEVLGQTKTCTVATCGSGNAAIGQFQLKDWLDSKITSPNLVAKFVDENGSPVVISNLLLARQEIDRSGDNRQPSNNLPGVFSVNLFPGSYGFYFCEPGYPGTENTGACHAYETGWFNVSASQTTNVTIQLPPYIEQTNSSAPNLVVKFLDENGNPVPNLRLQICNVDTLVKVCSPDDIPDNKLTDANGVFRDALRSGRYIIRFNWPGVGYGREWTHALEIDNINISQNDITKISYQFPAPNLVVKLTDAVGAPVPNHFLLLCNTDHQLGNCANFSDTPSPVSEGSYTNQQGVFKAVVKPGNYFLLTDRFPTFVTFPTDYSFNNINVTSATETTTVEFQLK